MKNLEKFKSILKRDLVINASDAGDLLGNKMAIYRLVERGEVEKLYDGGPLGLFYLPGITEEEACFCALSKYYSNLVVSGTTCLAIYGLSDDYIETIHVDIEYPQDLKNSLFTVHRVSKARLGPVEEKSFPEKNIKFPIKIYSVERALHEAHRYYGKTDSFYRSINRYKENYLNKKSPGKQYDLILSINKKVGQEIVGLLSMGDVS